jgi:hypothetical protein
MVMAIQDVVRAARVRFGEVMSVTRTGEGEYFVACKRREPALPDRPFMTITAATREDDRPVEFYWGHYDLTVDEVHVAIGKVKSAVA